VNLLRGIVSGLLVVPALAVAQSLPRTADASHALRLVDVTESIEPGATGPRKPRLALRMRSDAAEHAVRSLGLDAAECAMLFRMSSRAVSTGGSTSVVLKPQMHLDCRF
jgi:hypothetical protein